MTILSHQSIVKLCTQPKPVITNYDTKSVRTASYDMRAGGFYYLSECSRENVVDIQTFDDRHSTVEVPPNQAIWVHMLESLDMPRHLVGHLSLKVDVLATGLIMASQSQIDATYEGPIFTLLYNLSDVSVPLKRGDRLVRLELAALDKETDVEYKGDLGPGSTLKDIVRKQLSSGIVRIDKRVDRLRIQGQIAAAIGAVSILISLIVLPLVLIAPVQEKAADATATAEDLRERVGELRAERDRAAQQLDGIRRRLRAVERRVARGGRGQDSGN